MPYVNLKTKAGLTKALAPVLGKALAKLQNEVEGKLNETVDNFRREGCPDLFILKGVDQNLQQVNRTIQQVDSRVNKIRRLPQKLKRPASGLEKAINVIKLLPIPQSVPPGFGIPVSITTKFADILHLLKEFVAKINEDIESIDAMLDAPSSVLTSVREKIEKIKIPTLSCKAEAALRDQVSKGSINPDDLFNKGLYNPEDDVYIFSSLVPIFLGDGTNTIQGLDGQALTQDQAINLLEDSLNTLDKLDVDQDIKQELRTAIDTFRQSSAEQTADNGEFSYAGPDGTIYKLEIVTDPKSPSIAPQRYGIAIDPSGVVVLKGPRSFSSSESILLDEIKFRIDNQLP